MPTLTGPIPNPFRKFNNMTYSISLYLQSHEQYNDMMENQNKDVSSLELLIQSGGAQTGSYDDGPVDLRGNFGAQRNKFFTRDFYLDDIQLSSYIAGTSTGGPQNTFEAKFTVTEPMGLTFMERLYNASVTHAKEHGIENFNPVNQIYLMVIRFYGYDKDGKQIINGNFDDKSDPNSYVEKWIPIMIRSLQFTLEDTKVVYRCECVCPQTQAGHGQIHGTIPFNMGLQGASLKELLTGPAGKPSAGGVITQGLIQALNDHQQALVKPTDGTAPKYDRADVYKIKFEDHPLLNEAMMSPMGTPPIERGATGSGMSASASTKASTGSAKKKGAGVQTQASNAGMKIVKFIDLAIRSSTFMAKQYKKINDANKNVTNFKPQKEPLNWFKIRPSVKVLGFDEKRQGYAYEITYHVSVYPVASVKTNDFDQERAITLHKEYDHWFTGNNTEVIGFKQDYNTFYFTSFSAKHKDDPNQNPTYQNNARAQRVFRPTSGEAQTGENLTDEQAANAASVLYSPQDLANVELDIVGDPDWLGQSELFYAAVKEGPGEAILNDGSINYDRAEVFFSINFNTVVDYNLDTGLADVTQQNIGKGLDGAVPGGLSQYAFVYRANTIISQFEKGKFTQQLAGTMVFIPEKFVKGLVDTSGLTDEQLAEAQQNLANGTTGAGGGAGAGIGLGTTGLNLGDAGFSSATGNVVPASSTTGITNKDSASVGNTQENTPDWLRPLGKG